MTQWYIEFDGDEYEHCEGDTPQLAAEGLKERLEQDRKDPFIRFEAGVWPYKGNEPDHDTDAIEIVIDNSPRVVIVFADPSTGTVLDTVTVREDGETTTLEPTPAALAGFLKEKILDGYGIDINAEDDDDDDENY